MSIKKSTKKGYKAEAEPKDDEDEALNKAKKAEGADDEDGDEDEGDEDDDGEMDKALLAEEDLEKALEGIGKKAPRSREAQLLAKGSNLSKAERRELAQILAGGAQGSSLSKALSEDETLSKAVDVSPALESLAWRVSSAFDDLGEKLEKSLDDQGEFNAAIGRSMIALGEIVRAQNAALKSLGDKLEKALDAPARAPKAVAGKKDELQRGDDLGAKKPTSNRDTLVKALEAATHDALGKGDVNKAAALRGDLARALTGGTVSPVGQAALAAMQKKS